VKRWPAWLPSMMTAVSILGWGSLLVLSSTSCSHAGDDAGDRRLPWEDLRMSMVEKLRDVYGVRDPRVLAAMQRVARHRFIPEAYRTEASYGDHPCPIGYGQTISQPFIVAYMTAKMNIQEGERILEIGTGSGYQAAILAELGAAVYSIEIVEALAEHARNVLAAEGYDGVKVLAGDGYRGWPEVAPFDAVIVTCAPESIPDALVDQLRDGGRMILPLGASAQRLVILRKDGDEVTVEKDLAVRFVPMVEGASGDE